MTFCGLIKANENKLFFMVPHLWKPKETALKATGLIAFNIYAENRKNGNLGREGSGHMQGFVILEFRGNGL